MAERPLEIRAAIASDAGAMARIFNQGIAERVATFETREQDADAIALLVASGLPILVAEREEAILAWAKIGPYDDAHDYYAGVGEATLYVERDARGQGVGAALLDALAAEAARRGLHKLVGKIFTTNEASIALVRGCGWRQVGVHLRHGRLDGGWRDVLVVEKLIGDAAD